MAGTTRAIGFASAASELGNVSVVHHSLDGSQLRFAAFPVRTTIRVRAARLEDSEWQPTERLDTIFRQSIGPVHVPLFVDPSCKRTLAYVV